MIAARPWVAAAPARETPTLVFAHGWGFDAGFWDAVRVRLRAWPQRVLERGYFASRPMPEEALPEGPLVAIGHSFGYLHLLERLARRRTQPCAWVSINGFARFGAGDDFPHGVDPRLIRRMLSRLSASPAAVVDEFRRRCGSSPAAGAPCLATLAHDLRAMQALDLRDHVRGRVVPMLALGGTADPVVPARMAAQALPACGIDWLRDGGHLLPLEAPDWCATRIAGFLARHGMAPAAEAEGQAFRVSPAAEALDRRSWRSRSCDIGTRFGAAAGGYDRHAGIQRQVASRLAARIARLDLPARPRILEIGCGTGLLTRMLGEHFSEADWTITDVSSAMLAQARRRLRLGGVTRYRVMDGENPGLEGGPMGFDLICSSMALQWFQDPAQGLARLAALLAPAGHLAVALPVDGTFSEWGLAHETAGLRPRMIPFPRPEDLRMACGSMAARFDVERIVDECGGALAFLRGLKGVGATASRAETRPLSPAALRRVCAEFDRAGGRCSYLIAYGLWRRRVGHAHKETAS
jgi:malonyl-CoA O-methyltransferase